MKESQRICEAKRGIRRDGWRPDLISTEEAFAQQQAWNKAAFEAKTLDETVKALGGPPPAQSADISITAPDIAENGAVVPVGVTSKIPNTQNVYILVEKNPEFAGGGLRDSGGHRSRTSRRASRWARRRTCTPSSRPTTSSMSPPRKSRSRSAVAAAEHVSIQEQNGRSDENSRDRAARWRRRARVDES